MSWRATGSFSKSVRAIAFGPASRDLVSPTFKTPTELSTSGAGRSPSFQIRAFFRQSAPLLAHLRAPSRDYSRDETCEKGPPCLNRDVQRSSRSLRITFVAGLCVCGHRGQQRRRARALQRRAHLRLLSLSLSLSLSFERDPTEMAAQGRLARGKLPRQSLGRGRRRRVAHARLRASRSAQTPNLRVSEMATKRKAYTQGAASRGTERGVRELRRALARAAP